MHMRSRSTLAGILLLACLAVLTGSAHAQTTLTGGRKITFKVTSDGSKSSGSIGFGKAPGHRRRGTRSRTPRRRGRTG